MMARTTELIALILLTIWFCSMIPASAEELALLVGINQYKHISGLSGCENDVAMIKDVLVKKFGFQSRNIQTLLSAQATGKAIRDGLRWLASEAQPGDVVVFHFSGHGSQVRDDRNATDEQDGLDETICPYDVNLGKESTHIRDDELNQLLNAIKADNLTVIFDSCHSGTATRSVNLTDAVIKPRVFTDPSLLGEPAAPDVAPSEPSSDEMTARRPVTMPQVDSSEVQGRGMSSLPGMPFTFISACAYNEVAGDAHWPDARTYRYSGVFTKYLVDNLSSAPRGLTYEQLLKKVVRDVRKEHWQTPQLEGRGQGYVVFASRTAIASGISVQPFARIIQHGGQNVSLDTGSRDGVTVGSQYAIYAPNEKTFKKPPLGRIKITSVGETEAEGRIDGKESGLQEGGRAIETTHYFPETKLKLRLAADSDKARKVLRPELAEIGYLSLVQTGYGYLLRAEPSSRFPSLGSLKLSGGIFTASGRSCARFEKLPAPEFLRKALSYLGSAYIQQEFVRLENRNAPFQVEVWMEHDGKPVPNPTFAVGEVLVFKFRVTGLKKGQRCYITMLDLQTDGSLNVLFPNKFMPSFEAEAGKEYTIPPTELLDRVRLRLQGPTGREVVKVIASTEPLYLAQIDPTRLEGFASIENGVAFAQEMVGNLQLAFADDTASRGIVLEEVAPATMPGGKGTRLVPTSPWATDTMVIHVEDGATASRGVLEMMVLE